MTKFFKKIGRGFRKLGRGLKKFFKSKIGKVLGTLILAVALPAMFNAFFTGGVTTGAGAGTVTKIGGTTVAAGSEATAGIAEIAAGTAGDVTAGGTIATAEASVKLGTRLRAALQQTGEIFMNPKDALKRSFDSLWGQSPDLITKQTQAETFLDPKIGDVAINISEEGALSDSKVTSMIKDINKQPDSIGDVISRVSEERGLSVPDVYKEDFELFKKATGSPTDIMDWEMGDDTLVKQGEFHGVWSGMNKGQRSQFLRSKAGRGYYEDLFGYSAAESKGIPGLNTLMEAPGTFKGVQPFSSLRDAWQEGKGLEKVGNIMGQVTETPVAKVLPGYEGIGASSSIYSAGKTGIAAYSILGPEETVRTPSSGYSATSAALAKQNLELGDALASAQPSNSVNLYDYTAQDMGGQNSMQIHQKILRDAGYSYGYGPNAVNT